MLRLIAMNDDSKISVPDLPAHLRYSVREKPALNHSLAEIEKEYIQQVLASVGGNKTRAAEILKIDRKTLRDKLN